MKPILVIGLGNPLMGGDGIGCAIAERLAPEGADVIAGGADLLRYAGDMEGRSRVIVIDAIEDDSPAGTITWFDDHFEELDDRQEHVHHLSAVAAIRLLQMVLPARFSLVTVSVKMGAARTAG